MPGEDQRTPPTPPPRAAILLIGNELLSGKIRDENGWHMTRFLRRRGIELVEISVVPDVDDAIGAALLRLAGDADLVFTSGGVGPTHDDRTLPAIAAAVGRPMVRHAEMEALIRRHFGERVSPASLAMADLPEGTVPCALPGWPVLRLELDDPSPTRVYILPGVPELLRAKLDRLEQMPDELPTSGGWTLESVDLALEESVLAGHLETIMGAHPGVEIGSYPRWEQGPDGRLRALVRVTFEAPVERGNTVTAAADALRAAVPSAILASGPTK